jgi:hypothetical protein
MLGRATPGTGIGSFAARLLDELGHCEIQLRTLGVKYGQHRASNRNRPRNENFLCAGGAVRFARLTGSRSFTRRGHRPPAIERDFLEQAAMFISPMSAFAAHYGLKSDIALSPKSVDTVAKVENRTTPKISRKLSHKPGLQLRGLRWLFQYECDVSCSDEHRSYKPFWRSTDVAIIVLPALIIEVVTFQDLLDVPLDLVRRV